MKALKKCKKALKYLYIRGYELGTSVREYKKGGKLGRDVRRRYEDGSVLVAAHSVEKGLGLKNVQPGHSGPIVRDILDALEEMGRDPARVRDFPFREAFRVVMAYMEFQEQFDTALFPLYPVLKEKYEGLCASLGMEYVQGVRSGLEAGAQLLPASQLLAGAGFDFEAFISSRHSIRSFQKKPLDENLVRRAVSIAALSPSACNRQPSQVYFCGSPEKVAEVDRLITGSAGFKGEVPGYLVVTTDRAYFSFDEQYQWYINGGIYLTYLSLALHSLGVGHCIMQWKAFYRTEEGLKALLGISPTEAIIAVIGCGYYLEEARCIRAQRRSGEEQLHILK